MSSPTFRDVAFAVAAEIEVETEYATTHTIQIGADENNTPLAIIEGTAYDRAGLRLMQALIAEALKYLP